MDEYLPTTQSRVSLPSVSTRPPKGMIGTLMWKKRMKWVEEYSQRINNIHAMQSEIYNRQLTDRLRSETYHLELSEQQAMFAFKEERREYIRQISQLKIEKEQAERDGANLRNRLTLQEIERGRIEIKNIKKEVENGLNETADRNDDGDVINLY